MNEIRIPLPEPWRLDDGEQPRVPKSGDRYLWLDGTVVSTGPGELAGKRFIVVRDSPPSGWWPEWLTAAAVAMDLSGNWYAYGNVPHMIHDAFTSGNCSYNRLSGHSLFDLKLPEWPLERWQDSLILNPHRKDSL